MDKRPRLKHRQEERPRLKRVRLLTPDESAMRPKLPRRGLDELEPADDDIVEAFSSIRVVRNYARKNPRAAKKAGAEEVESFWWNELAKRMWRKARDEKASV